MASLYKKPVLKIDPKTGEKTKTVSKKWWGQYRNVYGQLKRVTPLFPKSPPCYTRLSWVVKLTQTTGKTLTLW